MAAGPFFTFAYRRSPDRDQHAEAPAHHPVIIIGAGPVGLTLALDVAQRGITPVLLDDSDRIGEGSRAIGPGRSDALPVLVRLAHSVRRSIRTL